MLFDCDLDLLPLKVGGLRTELFANWDDDNHLNNSSLIKRGLYPEHLRSKSQIVIKPSEGKNYTLRKGESTSYQYCPDVNPVQKLPMKYICIKKGSVKVTSNNEAFALNEGQSIWISANIPHTLVACVDCVFQVYIDSGL